MRDLRYAPNGGEKGFLGQGDPAHHFHSFFAFFLFFEQFSVAGHVAAMKFGLDVFAVGLDVLAGDDFATDGDLNGDLKLLTGNGFLEAFGQSQGAGASLTTQTNSGQGRGFFVVQENRQFDQIGFLPANRLVVNRGKTGRGAFEAIVERGNDLDHRNGIGEFDQLVKINHINERTAEELTNIKDGAKIIR